MCATAIRFADRGIYFVARREKERERSWNIFCSKEREREREREIWIDENIRRSLLSGEM